MSSNSRVNPLTSPCVNLAPGCIDHVRNSLWAGGITLALLATLCLAVPLAVM
jgi:hypothetical protein